MNSRLTGNAKASRAEDERCNIRIVVVRLLLFLLLSSCATLIEDERFEQEDRLILAREQFYRQAESCRRNGGVIQITTTQARLGQYNRHDYRSAKCVVY